MEKLCDNIIVNQWLTKERTGRLLYMVKGEGQACHKNYIVIDI